jgi:origin recognition complex subunit 1
LSQATNILFTDRRTVELVQPAKKTAGMREVKEVISAMQNSPTAGYLQELSLHERIMLAAVSQMRQERGGGRSKMG